MNVGKVSEVNRRADLALRQPAFQMLLYLVYEIPHKKADMLDALKASVAQTAAFAVCGFSLGSRPRTRGQISIFEIDCFSDGRTADPKDGGPRYTNRLADGAPMNWRAPRTRATSLSPLSNPWPGLASVAQALLPVSMHGMHQP
jgi:hypothetical protein